MNNEPTKKLDDNENTWIYILTKKNKGDIKEIRGLNPFYLAARNSLQIFPAAT